MNPIVLLLSFAPWLLFALIAGKSMSSLETAIIVCTALTVLLGYKQLRKRYLLTWGTLLFFVFCLIAVGLMKNVWVATNMNALSYGALAAITWGSLLVGMPFTMQYAKEEVDRSHWDSPAFIHANRLITAVWGVLFLANLGISIYRHEHSGMNEMIFTAAGWIIMLIGVAFTTAYSSWAHKKRLQAEAAASSLSVNAPTKGVK